MPIDPLISAVPAFVEELDPRVVGASDVVVVEGIEGVYRRMYPHLVRLAFLLVDTREHAEEAVQDAFARAYPRWSRIESPEAYLHRAVVNACRGLQRRRAVARRLGWSTREEALHEGDDVADAVRALPSPQREAVVLRYYLQLSEPEIARVLDMPVGTVKSTLSRARTRLKKELS